MASSVTPNHGAALLTPHGTKRVLTAEAATPPDEDGIDKEMDKENEEKREEDGVGNPFRERTTRILNSLDRAGFGSPTPGWAVKQPTERKRVTRSFENPSSEDVFGYKRPAKKSSKICDGELSAGLGEAGGVRVATECSPSAGSASVVRGGDDSGGRCSKEDGSGENVSLAITQSPQDEVSEVASMIGMDETLDKEPEEDEDDLVAQGLPKGSLTEPLEMKVPGPPSPKGGMIHKFFDFYFGSFCCSQKDQRADHAAARKRIKEDERAAKQSVKRSGARKRVEELSLLNGCFRDKSNFGDDHASSDDESKTKDSEAKSDPYQPIYIQPRAGLKGILKSRISDEKLLMCDPDVLREKKRVRFTIPEGEGAGEKEYTGFTEADEGMYLAHEMNSCWELRSKGHGTGTEKPYWLTQCFPGLGSLGLTAKGKGNAGNKAKTKEVEDEKESDGEPWKSGKISFLNLKSLDTKGEDNGSFVRMQIYPVEKVDTEKELTERIVAEMLAEGIVEDVQQNTPDAQLVNNGTATQKEKILKEPEELTKLPNLGQQGRVHEEMDAKVQEKEVMGTTKKAEEGRSKSYVADHVKHPEKYTKYALDWSAQDDDKSNLKAFEESRAHIATSGPSTKQYRPNPNPPTTNDFVESNENQPLNFTRQESKLKDEERGVLTEKESNVVVGNEENSIENRKAEVREEERKGEDSRGKSEDKIKFVHRRRNSGSSAESIEMDGPKNRDRRKHRSRVTLGGAVDWQAMLELELGSVHGSIGSGSESLSSEVKDLNEVDITGKQPTPLESGNPRRGRNYRSRRSNSGDGWD